MSDRIHELIDGIRSKATSLRDHLSVESTKNEALQKEVESLLNQISSKDEEMAKLQSKISELELNMSATQEQEVIVSDDTGVSKEQIDELVKEIDYCIEQLKK
ncbi:MAG: hypothetical protein QNK23_04715 [Crocinitomicaceae bacterium]|nr:hypothetical protein [Crocinitomicaceae bacterium]